MGQRITVMLHTFGESPWRSTDEALRYSSIEQSMVEDRAYCYRPLIQIQLRML
jgi:hypothetical protein